MQYKFVLLITGFPSVANFVLSQNPRFLFFDKKIQILYSMLLSLLLGTFLVITSLFFDLFLISMSYFLIIAIASLCLRFSKLDKVMIDNISVAEIETFGSFNLLRKNKSDLDKDKIKNILKTKLEELDEEFSY